VASKTRDKILKTALKEFNERGFGNVSLADLAAAAGIAKGNLWYHFKDKEALLEALNAAYIERLEWRKTLWPEPGREIEGFAELLRTITDEIRDFRFMFRDQSSYGEHSQTLLDELAKIYDDAMRQFTAFIEALRRDKRIEIADNQLAPLVFNLTLGLRYHLEFLREIGQSNDPKSGGVESALQQCATHFDGKMAPAALKKFRRLLGQTQLIEGS